VVERWNGEDMRAAIYSRVSTTDQEAARQDEECRAYCRGKEWEIVSEFTDTVSGTKDQRPGWSRLEEEAHRHRFDVLVVWEVSRLSRRGPGALLDILARLSAWDVSVVSLREPFLSTDGPYKDLLVAIFGWVAKIERDMISERTKSALRQRRALGIIGGRPKRCQLCGHRRKHGPYCRERGCECKRPPQDLGVAGATS
jgi:DNA invertase Pin-like site-specific DNA recombinase